MNAAECFSECPRRQHVFSQINQLHFWCATDENLNCLSQQPKTKLQYLEYGLCSPFDPATRKVVTGEIALVFVSEGVHDDL